MTLFFSHPHLKHLKTWDVCFVFWRLQKIRLDYTPLLWVLLQPGWTALHNYCEGRLGRSCGWSPHFPVALPERVCGRGWARKQVYQAGGASVLCPSVSGRSMRVRPEKGCGKNIPPGAALCATCLGSQAGMWSSCLNYPAIRAGKISKCNLSKMEPGNLLQSKHFCSPSMSWYGRYSGLCFLLPIHWSCPSGEPGWIQ